MPYEFAIIGGDCRQKYLANELLRQGHLVHTFSVPELPDTDGSLQGALCHAQYIILPIDQSQITQDALIKSIPPDAVVFSGKSDLPNVQNYLTWETLAILNAVPTAEGAIQLAMEHMPATICGSYFLVVGAGRIGMCLAQKLQALGAHVTVSARKKQDIARIESHGLTADTTGHYDLGLQQYDCIMNSVPAPVFTPAQLATANDNCILIELASAPGGFPKDVHPIISGAALPGRVAPKTAGQLLAREILNFIKE